jgi:SMODS and SLOG-associating 2TM effector domain 1
VNPVGHEQQQATLRGIWERHRAFANTSVRLKGEQGQWRRCILVASVVALLGVPFSKTLEKYGLTYWSSLLTVAATVLFALIGWLNESILGEESQQPWVRARQTAEALKGLAFQFLIGVPPFDAQDAPTRALQRAEALVGGGGVADRVSPTDAEKGMPPAPITPQDYLRCRVEEQLGFYEQAIERERKANRRIVLIGRGISGCVILFGAIGALITDAWREIWAPALGAASALVTTQMAVSRHRFLLETYSLAADKLRFARTSWSASLRASTDAEALTTTVESALAGENAGWVQLMLLKPVVPDKAAPPVKG